MPQPARKSTFSRRIKLTVCAVTLTLPICGCAKRTAPPPKTTTTSVPLRQSIRLQPTVVRRSAIHLSASLAKIAPVPEMPPKIFPLNSLMYSIPATFTQRPDGGWGTFTRTEVQQWIQKHLYGKTCDVAGVARVAVRRSQPPPSPHSSEPGGHAVTRPTSTSSDTSNWKVFMAYSVKVHSNYAGMANTLVTSSNYSFNCSEADAHKWSEYPAPILVPVKVTGRISRIQLTALYAGENDTHFLGYKTKVSLDQISVTRSRNWAPVAMSVLESDLGYPLSANGGAIVRMKQLDSNGAYYLELVTIWNPSSGQRPACETTRLCLFPIEIIDNFGVAIRVTPIAAPNVVHTISSYCMTCSNPPTASQIAQVKKEGGWPKWDCAKSLKRCEKGAAQGKAVAEYYLGLMYYQGEAVPRHYSMATKWWGDFR